MGDAEGNWEFHPFHKTEDEGGRGYWMENFEGPASYVEYDTERTDGGMNIMTLEGPVFLPDPEPVVETTEEEFSAADYNDDVFDPNQAEGDAEREE